MSDMVIEFLERKRLSEMGLTQSLDGMSAEHVDALLIIDMKRDEIQKK